METRNRDRREEKRAYYQKRAKAEPWWKNFYFARSRCYKNAIYGKKNIQFLMSLEDFKYLWFRDKAYLMKKPSIDRIKNSGNYILNNCRYVEFLENCKRQGE